MSGEIVRLRLSSEQANAFNALGAVEKTRLKYAHISRVIYGGQAGGGKSFLICLWLDHMAQAYPATRYYMARERLKDIKESVLLTYWDVIAQNGSKVHYNAQSNYITYPNGSQIYLVDCFAYPSDPNFDSMGSREYTAGAIEEGITVTERAASILLSRTRYKHDVFGLTPKQLITCNPGEGWIKDKIVMPALDGLPMQANEIFVRATLDSNPNKQFVKQYSKTLDENLSAFDRARLMHGDWNAKQKTGAEFLKEFSQAKHVAPVRYDSELALHVSFDENVHPHITALLWQIQKHGDMRWAVQVGEVCQPPPNNSRKRVCETIIKRYWPLHKGGMFIYGDATSQKNDTAKEYGENFFTDIMLYLKCFNPKLRVPPANPPVVSKGGFMNIILEKTYRSIRIVIDPSCKLSISDYSFTLEDSDGSILKKKVTNPDTQISYEKHGHHCFVAGTMITTSTGQRPIEKIRPGELALTRHGFRKVIVARMTRKDTFVNSYEIGLTSTSGHKIWTENRGFVKMRDLMQSDTLCILDAWNEKQSFSTVRNFIATRNQKAGVSEHTLAGELKDQTGNRGFMSSCVNFITGLSKKDLWSIIKITIRSIIQSRILNYWKRVNIQDFMSSPASGSVRPKTLSTSKISETLQKNGTLQKKDTIGMLSMVSKLLGIEKKNHSIAFSAVKKLNPLTTKSIFAPAIVNPITEESQESITSTGNVSRVGNDIQSTDTLNPKIVQSDVRHKVEPPQNVYNIEVEEHHEYFANGILVKNCDAMSYFICESFKSDFMHYMRGGVTGLYEVGTDKREVFQR